MFEGSKLKVKRANHHIEELDTCLKSYFSSGMHRLHFEDDPERGSLVSFELTSDLPSEIPLIIGDAVHNLRAALDILFCDVVRSCGEFPDQWTKFPFRDTRDNLLGALKQGKLKAAKPEVIDAIADAIKPYRGGDDALYGLNRLDIQDKHLLLIPTVTLVALSNVEVGDAGNNLCTFDRVQLAGGPRFRPIVRVLMPPARIARAQPFFGIVFGEAHAFNGEAIVPTLHQLSKRVLGAIEALERASS